MRAHRDQVIVGQGKTYGETAYLYLFRCYVRHFVRHNNNSDVLSHRGELFLRILIEMWLEGNNESYSESEMQQQNVEVDDDSLESAFDKTQVCGQYNYTPSYTLDALKQMVSYICTDGNLKQRVFEASSSYSTQWCLPPAMTVLQQPLFTFIRLALRYAPIHSRSSSTFYSAFSMWLRLLEPWNRNSTSAGKLPAAAAHQARQRLNQLGLTSGPTTRADEAFFMPDAHANAPSKYTREWESYIVANIHLYTTLFSVFLRRSRELDFSAHAFNRSLSIVQRVFRVFSPAVVNVIKSTAALAEMPTLRKMHESNLGGFCPKGSINLNDCASDVNLLLEEIHMQHQKKINDFDVIERFEDFLEGFFLNGGSKKTNQHLKKLVSEAKRIFDLPADYTVMPVSFAATRSRRVETEKDRQDRAISTGLLTETGREQVLAGAILGNPLEISALGDPLSSRVVGSYEIPALVDLSIRASNWLNQKCGLIPPENGAGYSASGVVDGDSSLHLLLNLIQSAENRRKVW
eukprot:CAMPEP_0196820212 /NCGR_PEP_ID=MMETSP1362-20130617/74279_1 /TAXON_ID=163516 /ORGANISM="Leptocylindrus danicus, Strain CCMP1856" /LENGTH=517 /DNA_ID=CAMNT_0042199001 /DNA_START=26 /DNA_END=1577 /DNA_ORIENTATION=-